MRAEQVGRLVAVLLALVAFGCLLAIALAGGALVTTLAVVAVAASAVAATELT